MKSIADDSNSNKSCSIDDIGKIAFSEFIDPSNQLKSINITCHMTNVVMKKDEQFKYNLSLTKNGTLTNEKFEFLINRFLS